MKVQILYKINICLLCIQQVPDQLEDWFTSEQCSNELVAPMDADIAESPDSEVYVVDVRLWLQYSLCFRFCVLAWCKHACTYM